LSFLERIVVPEASFPGGAESVAFRAALEVVRAVEPGVADAISAELASQRSALIADRELVIFPDAVGDLR
jgi:hypothetical protein